MQTYVRMLSGRTNLGVDVSGRVFQLVQQPRKNHDGLHITVENISCKDMRNGRNRIYIDNVSCYEPAQLADLTASQLATGPIVDARTDDDIRTELSETFEILQDMTGAVAGGVVKGLVVSGPAGIGKSHTVEVTLKKNLDILAKMKGVKSMYECIHGAMSASVLYEKLWLYRETSNVLVFDDCDGILYDEDALNILKAALDSKAKRQIHWNTNSYILDRKDIPNSFEYEGGIIFITNVDFTQVRSPRIANHLEAIVSRCHYMLLGINSPREKMIHIKNVVDTSDMLQSHLLTDIEKKDVMEYVIENANSLREISLRTVLKTADVRKAMPTRWRAFADKTILK